VNDGVVTLWGMQHDYSMVNQQLQLDLEWSACQLAISAISLVLAKSRFIGHKD
jgi:hypothetical protein